MSIHSTFTFTYFTLITFNYLHSHNQLHSIKYTPNQLSKNKINKKAKWKKELEKEYPTVAFHANINNPFGKSALMSLLRQFSKLHSDKKQISIGFVGYPNTGKSSIINTLKQKKVCNVAPIPGETRCWQYITLMKRIYLIDCPGVVYGSSKDSETDIILKGVVRVENVENTQEHIPVVLERCRREYLERTYGVSGWSDHLDFLKMIAEKSGKLLKGGEADVNTVSKMILNDWIRGKIPFYTLPPDSLVDVKNSDIKNSDATKVDIKNTDNGTNVDIKKSDARDVDIKSGKIIEKTKETEDFVQDVSKTNKGPKYVQQRMKNIRVIADFMKDDMHGPSDHDDNDNEAEDDESVFDDDETSEFDAEANWDEVFKAAVGNTEPVTTTTTIGDDDDERTKVDRKPKSNVPNLKPKSKSNSSVSKRERRKLDTKQKPKSKREKKMDLSDSDSEIPLPVPLSLAGATATGGDGDGGKKRMTTSKTKATNYYTTANVKNKNRDKKGGRRTSNK